MSSGTYSGTYATIDVTISPATIVAGATIYDTLTSGVAVYAGSLSALTNDGLIHSTVENDAAVKSLGTALLNGGTIEAAGYGVVLTQGTLTNGGLVEAGGRYATAVATLVNQSGGTIDDTDANGFSAAEVGILRNYGLIEGAANGAVGSTLVNAGLIEGGGALGAGVGVTLTNQAGGRIEAIGTALTGVELYADAAAYNASGATISGPIGASLLSGATLTNAGTIQSGNGTAGVAIDFLADSGLVIEEASGTVVGMIDGFQSGDTIELAAVSYSSSDTVTYDAHSQEIIVYGAGHTTLSTLGVAGLPANEHPVLRAAGTATAIEAAVNPPGTYSGYYTTIDIQYSPATITASATIDDTSSTGVNQTGDVVFDQATSTLTNDGLIIAGNSALTAVSAGDEFANAGTIESQGAGVVGGSTIVNSGQITAAAAWAISTTGDVTNAAGGLIEGSSYGVELTGTGTIAEYGTISGAVESVRFESADDTLLLGPGAVLTGVALGDGGMLALGTGIGTLSGFGTGTLSGSASATVSGFARYLVASGGDWTFAGYDVVEAGTELTVDGSLVLAGTMENFGTIIGSSASDAAISAAGGTITNYGTIEGGAEGVVLTSAGTVVAAGAFEGTSYAVEFLGGAAEVLIVQPGVDLIGKVAGDGGTLVFGSATGAGTLTGLGTQYAGFSRYLLGTGETWTLAGSDTIASGSTLVVDGSLTATGSLSLAGSADIAGGTLIVDQSLTGTGTIELSNHATLDLAAGGTGVVAFTDATGVLMLGDPAATGVTIADMIQGDVIDLTGVSYGASEVVSYAKGTLTVAENGAVVAEFAMTGVAPGTVFGVIGDGHGGSEIVAQGPPLGIPLADTLPAGAAGFLETALTRLAADVQKTQHLTNPGLNVLAPATLVNPQGAKILGDVNIADGKPLTAGETITLGKKLQGIVLSGHRAADIVGHAANAYATAELLVGNAGNDTIVGNGGSGTVISGSGANTIRTGKGNMLVVSDGHDLITTGKGDDTVLAYGSATVHGGAGTTVFEDLGTASGADKVRGGGGTTIMESGLGRDTFIGGSGTSDMVDTGQGDVAFQFNVGTGGIDVVTGFDAARGDYIRITANSWSAEQILGHMTVSGGNAFVDLADGTKIEFVGVTSLTASDFHS